jgi:hypothetical protein
MPTIQQVVLGYDNSLAELDVDIVLDVTDDTATLAAEEFQTLSELARIYGPQEVPFDDMLELSSLPDKRKLMEKRKARQEAAQQQGGQGQQMQMQAARSRSWTRPLGAAQAGPDRQDRGRDAEDRRRNTERSNPPHVEAVRDGFQMGQKPAAGDRAIP